MSNENEIFECYYLHPFLHLEIGDYKLIVKDFYLERCVDGEYLHFREDENIKLTEEQFRKIDFILISETPNNIPNQLSWISDNVRGIR